MSSQLLEHEVIEKETLVEVKNLFCIHGNRYTLTNINWEVKRGENWLVFGLNGSGKTTLLSIIAGFTEGSSGTVKVFGQEYDKENTLELRKRIGWVSSSFFDRYYQNETALNIVLSGLFGTLGVSDVVSDADMRKALSLMEELHLKKKENRVFSTMSKGERQNVMIARALISNPEILVLDEPGNGLDVLAREYMLETVMKLAQERNITVLYVTHYVEEILPMFDKTILMKDGYIVEQGKTGEMFENERLSQLLGYPVVATQDALGNVRVKLEVESTFRDLNDVMQEEVEG